MKYIFCNESYALEGAKLAVDGSLIQKRINYVEGATYFDRKGNYCINGMFVFDTNSNIRNIFKSEPGSTNNKRIFTESWLAVNIEELLPGNKYMLGDSGYTLSNKVLIPYNSTQLRSDPQGFKSIYNKIQSSARMAAERGIGMLKQRFKKLMNGLTIYKASTSVKFIVSASIFHQILLNIEDGYNEGISTEEKEQMERESIEDRHTYRVLIAEKLYYKHIRISNIG